MALTTNIAMGASALLTGSSDLGPSRATQSLHYGRDWASGVLASQADVVWGDTRTLAASATEDLDLAGVLVGALGATVTFARVKFIMVTADAANTNNVVVGGAATNTWVGPFGAATHTLAVQPGGFYAEAAPGATAWPVTATTADLLKVANSAGGTAVTYSIILIGASA
jgi:hypothetical protein